MRGKNYLWTLFILTFLASMAMVSVPATPSPGVTFRVEPEITTGVQADKNVTVDVYIDADPDTAVVGWGITMKVNPDVLKPGYEVMPGVEILAASGAEGYYLYDWCIAYPWNPDPGKSPTLFLTGSKDEAAGVINSTVEGIKLWTELPVGVGANGTGKLATFYFTSKSPDAYSTIEIVDAAYYTSWNSPELDKHVPDTIINGHYCSLPGRDVAVTAISAPSEATVGETVNINVNVSNLGTFTETFNLEVSYDTNVIENRSVSLDSGASGTELFSWNTTTDVTPGSYMITAKAILAEDDYLANNEASTPITILKVPGIYRIDLVRRSAWPEHHSFSITRDEDGVMNLYAIIKNVGDVTTYGKVVFTITTATGVFKCTAETIPLLLEPGDIYGNLKDYFAEWTPDPKGDLGTWYVNAEVYYDDDGYLETDDWTPSPDKPKTFKFTVKP